MFTILLLLEQCNDIHPNPGPDSTRHEHRNISIVNINVNSLRHKTDLIGAELSDYDIICVTESKLDNSVKNCDISIDNFFSPEQFRKDRLVDRGGGLLIYVRNNIYAKRRLDLEHPDIESLCIEVSAHNRNFLLICFYRPPNARIISWDHIENLFHNAVDTGFNNLIFLGDINVDLMSIGLNHRFSRLCETLSIQNVINEPTRITPTSSTLIDPILVNNLDIVRDSFVLPNFCSDHCPSVVELNFTTPRQKTYVKTVWDFDHANYDAIENHLQDIDWDGRLSSSNDVNFINENINGEITLAMDQNIPKKTIRIRPRDKPWINNVIKCKIRKRNRIHKKAKSRNLASDWENFRKIRNEIIDMIREAKKDYIVNLQNSLVDKNVPPGKWWRIAKSVTKFKNKNTTSSPLKVNGEIYYHPIDKANAINDYFATVSSLDVEPEIPNIPPLAPCELSDIVVSEQEIFDQFQILNVNKPGGPDNLPPKFLKAIFQSIVKPLLILFNKSLYYGLVPIDWKMANVSAIYKGKGGPDSATNYRPISVTNCFSKMLEKIIFKHLHNYLLQHDILSHDQSGFKHGDSTVNQLLIIYDTIMKNLDIGKDVRFVFCDVSKAFDRVWHRGLLYKLRKYGIKGNLLNWFGNYLTDRKQRVCMEGCNSSWKSIHAGVPQGSILVPYLFLLFINDIVDVVSNKMKLFADDTSLYCIVDEQQIAAESLNSDLDSLHTWAQNWGVTFNATKTKSILFTRKHDIDIPVLNMNNIELENTCEHKHLGLTFNHTGTWKNHINEIYSKAFSRLNILRMLKYNIDRKSLEKLYFGFIRPILEYGNVVWDNCTKQESDLIESVQYEAARIVTGLRKGTSRSKLYSELGWDSLENRRQKQKLILMFKALHGYLPNYFSEIFSSHLNPEANYMLRNHRIYNVPRVRTRSYSKSFFPSVMNMWNNLDEDIRNIPYISLFKKKLNDEITQPPSYYSSGPRKMNIIICQLRNNVSNLNDHLFRAHLSDSSQCPCGDAVEDCFHYFYVCPLYMRHRIIMFQDLRRYRDILNLEILLQGSDNLSLDENLYILQTVYKYIENTGRFT